MNIPKGNGSNWSNGQSGGTADDAFWSFLDAQSEEELLAPEVPKTYKQFMFESKKLINFLKRKYGVPHSEAILNRIKKFTGLDDTHLDAFEKVREDFDGIFSESPDKKLLFVKVPPYGDIRDQRAKESKAVYEALLNVKKDLEIHPAWLILEQEEKEIISDYELFEDDELVKNIELISSRVDEKKESNQEMDVATINAIGNLMFQMIKKNDMMKNRLDSGIRTIKYLYGFLKEEGILENMDQINDLIEKSTSELAKIEEEAEELKNINMTKSSTKEKLLKKLKGAPPKTDDISRKMLLLIGLKQRSEELNNLWKHNTRTTEFLRKEYLSVLIWGKKGISRQISRLSADFVKNIQTEDNKERTEIVEQRKEQFRQDLIDCGYLTEEELHLIIVGDYSMGVDSIPGGKIFTNDINEGIFNAEKLLDFIAKIELLE